MLEHLSLLGMSIEGTSLSGTSLVESPSPIRVKTATGALNWPGLLSLFAPNVVLSNLDKLSHERRCDTTEPEEDVK